MEEDYDDYLGTEDAEVRYDDLEIATCQQLYRYGWPQGFTGCQLLAPDGQWYDQPSAAEFVTAMYDRFGVKPESHPSRSPMVLAATYIALAKGEARHGQG